MTSSCHVGPGSSIPSTWRAGTAATFEYCWSLMLALQAGQLEEANIPCSLLEMFQTCQGPQDPISDKQIEARTPHSVWHLDTVGPCKCLSSSADLVYIFLQNSVQRWHPCQGVRLLIMTRSHEPSKLQHILLHELQIENLCLLQVGILYLQLCQCQQRFRRGMWELQVVAWTTKCSQRWCERPSARSWELPAAFTEKNSSASAYNRYWCNTLCDILLYCSENWELI